MILKRLGCEDLLACQRGDVELFTLIRADQLVVKGVGRIPYGDRIAGDGGSRDIFQRAGLCRNSEQLHCVLICGVIPHLHDLPSLDASYIHLFSVLIRYALGILQ